MASALFAAMDESVKAVEDMPDGIELEMADTDFSRDSAKHLTQSTVSISGVELGKGERGTDHPAHKGAALQKFAERKQKLQHGESSQPQAKGAPVSSFDGLPVDKAPEKMLVQQDDNQQDESMFVKRGNPQIDNNPAPQMEPSVGVSGDITGLMSKTGASFLGLSVQDVDDVEKSENELPHSEERRVNPGQLRFPDLSEPETPRELPPPPELTEEENNDIMGDLLGLGADPSDDSSEGSDGSSMDEVEFGDEAVKKKPEANAKKEDKFSDSWDNVATNEAEVLAVAAKKTAQKTEGAGAVRVQAEVEEKLVVVGSAKTESMEADDEFDYVFEGKRREGKHHVVEYVPKAAPSHLITNLKNAQMGALQEEDEEEEEEEVEVEVEIEIDDEVALVIEDESTPQAASHPKKPTAAIKAPPPPKADDLASEWEVVTQHYTAELQAKKQQQDGGRVRPVAPAAPPVSYKEAVHFFSQADISMHLTSIEVEEPSGRGLFSFLFKFCFAPPALEGELAQQRERAFAVAKMKFDEHEPMHFRILQSVFKRLTSHQGVVPRVGGHWADIGFQGNDPTTDLRAMGMLGPLQMLHLTTLSPPNAAKIYALSRDPTQEFPLAPVSIMLTKHALVALRKGHLSKEINKCDDVMVVLNAFYVGCFYEFYTKWRDGGKTMVQSGFFNRELEDYCLSGRHVAALLAKSRETLGGREPKREKIQLGEDKEVELKFSEY